MKNRKIIEITLLLSATFTMMAGAIIAPTLPQMERVFSGIENIALLTRLVLSIPAIFTALFSPVFGYLADKWGRKKLLIASLTLYAVSGASGFVLNDIYVILIGRAFLGIAVAGIMTISSTLIGDYFVGSERNKFLGLQGAFMGFGGVLFVSIAGGLADIGWNYPYLIYLFSLIVVITGSVSLYEPTKPCPVGYQNKRSMVHQLDAIKVYVLVFIGIVFFYMMPVQLPFLLDKLPNMTNTKIGFSISIMNLSAAFVALFYKRIREKLTFHRIYLFVLLFMGGGYFIIADSQYYSLILVGSVVAGIGIGLLMPLGNLWIMELAPVHKRARMVSNVTTVVYLGQFLSPFLFQSFITYFGVTKLFMMASLVLIFFAIILFLIDYTKKSLVLKY